MEFRASNVNEPVVRPTNCPYCNGRAVDTLAKVVTLDTAWRCRSCEQTWTLRRPPVSRR